MILDEIKESPNVALLVVDQQIDFEPDGALPVAGGDEIADSIARLIREFKNVILTQDSHPAGHISFASSYEGKSPYDLLSLAEVEAGKVKSVFSKEVLSNYLKRVSNHSQVLWPDHCVIGTKGWNFDPKLPLDKATLILKKGTRIDCDSYSAFFENDGSSTGLSGHLKKLNIKTLVITGLAGDYCVFWSARDAIKEGFKVIFDESLTRFVNFPKGSREHALHELKTLGVVFEQL